MRQPTAREWKIIESAQEMVRHARGGEWEESVTESVLRVAGMRDDGYVYAITIKRTPRSKANAKAVHNNAR